MAENTAFFEVIERQYALKLPFVVYSRPINSKIKCWLQKDDELHTTTSYEDSGFVFAAFDHNKDAVLFPQDICDFATIDMSNFAVSATEISRGSTS
jgi:isochorismate synthase